MTRGGRASLPSVDRLLGLPGAVSLAARHGRTLTHDALRAVLAEVRTELGAHPGHDAPDDAALLARAERHLDALTQPSLRPVFNLTGTVLHTNLGRALLPQVAVDAAAQAMSRPVNLEYDIGGAARGERDEHIERWLVRLTGAEAAAVVNNNAAAVFLCLAALAKRKEVLVSRGELVEIGGSFRIPDIMASAGCKLREVGTTNRTHPKDFEGAIGPNTAALMKVHASNYKVEGFTASVPEATLAEIAHRHGLPLLNDLGSGTLVNLEDHGLPHEPTPREAIAAGADLVTFSGDKMLGGPQCGLVVGRRELVAKVRKHPMKRALRLDKVRLAMLEAVLRLYASPERLVQELPTLRLLTRPAAEISALAERILPAAARALEPGFDVRVVACASQIGSGALPVESLASAGLGIVPRGKRRGGGLDTLSAALRALPVPVIGRIQDGELLLDLRCLEDEAAFVAQLPMLRLP